MLASIQTRDHRKFSLLLLQIINMATKIRFFDHESVSHRNIFVCSYYKRVVCKSISSILKTSIYFVVRKTLFTPRLVKFGWSEKVGPIECTTMKRALYLTECCSNFSKILKTKTKSQLAEMGYMKEVFIFFFFLLVERNHNLSCLLAK